MGQTDVATDTETHTQTQTGIIVCLTDMQSQGKTQADYITSWINVRLITNAAGLFGTSVYASIAVHSIWIFNYYEIINGFRSIKGLQ